MRPWMIASTVLLACSFSLTAHADKASFQQHYHAYQQALQAKDQSKALSELELAYQQANDVYPTESEDFANLAISLANHRLNLKKIPNEQIHPLYVQALASYEKLYGAADARVLEPLLGAAKTTSADKDKLTLLQRALEIATATNDPTLRAEVQIEAFDVISKTPLYSKKHLGWLEDAYTYLSSPANQNKELKLRATFLLGNAHMHNYNLEKSASLLNDVVAQTKGLNFSHPYALASHARLVSIYERQGESAAATEHCLALGSMQPWNDNQDPVPLYRVEPKYPERAARAGKDGFAILQFTINESGAVQNIKVVATGGSETFGEAATAALAKWRYAPKFADGKATTADAKVRLDFRLKKL